MRNPLKYLEYDENGKFNLKKTIQSTKDWYNYHKMVRKYQRKLAYDARHTQPWEYGHLIDTLLDGLRFMQEYYEKGINVWGMEQRDVENQFEELKNFPTRKEMIDEILKTWDEYENANDKMHFYTFNWIPASEIKKSLDENNNCLNPVLDKSFIPNPPYKTMGEAFAAEHAYEEEKWNKFWGLIRDCLEYLWD